MGGTVIKAGEMPGPGRGMLRLELRDIGRQAEDFISTARTAAARVLEEARIAAAIERERATEEGRRAGYTDGESAGRAAGREAGHAEALDAARKRFEADHGAAGAALARLIETLEGEAHRLAQERARLEQCVSRDAVVLAISIAERVIGSRSGIESELLSSAATACAEALHLLGNPAEFRLRLHPLDVEALQRLGGIAPAGATDGVQPAPESATGTAWRRLLGSAAFALIEDETIGRGGVVVEGCEATIDGRLADRVRRIADELASNWRARAAELGIKSDGAPPDSPDVRDCP